MQTIASHNEPHQYSVYLSRTPSGHYLVTFGFSQKSFKPDEYVQAVTEFQACVKHAMGCNGHHFEEQDDGC